MDVGEQFWIRGFWGFRPEVWACVGFTLEANRQKFLAKAKTGDLVLIYGTNSRETGQEERKQALGIFQIEARPVDDVDCIERQTYAEKVAKGWRDKWRYAVPATKAWEIVRSGQIDVKYVATDTYRREFGRQLGSMGVLLTPKDVERVLRLPLRERAVFPNPPLNAEGPVERAEEIFRPSKGIPPSFGKREVAYEDGGGKFYILKLEGRADILLGKQSYEIGDRAIFKFGYAQDPESRRKDYNDHLPGGSVFTWQIYRTSRAFLNAQKAFDSEQKFRLLIKSKNLSLGREFFLASPSQVDSLFNEVESLESVMIMGGSRR
jgi:hypothetical protein